MDFGIEIQQADGGWRQWQPKRARPALKTKVPRPPATFLSLPRELHTLITSHIDKSTALSLLTVCRQLVPVAEQRIWRDINLVLPQHYGEFPLIRPHDPHSSRYCDWAKKEATAAEERRRMATKEHVKDIIIRGSRERFGMVEHVLIEPAKGVNSTIIQLLDMVADNIKSLVISGVERHVFEQIWHPDPHETFFFKLCDFGATFSHLTHLDVSFTGNDHYHDIWTILHLAPALRNLRIDARAIVDFATLECDECDRSNRPLSVTAVTLPQLVRLEMLFNSNTLDLDDYDSILDIINLCRSLTHLKVNDIAPYEQAWPPWYLWDTSSLVHLEWRAGSSDDFTEAAQNLVDEGAGAEVEVDLLLKLRTLIVEDDVVSCSQERLEGIAIPPLKGLKTLIIRTESASSITGREALEQASFPDSALGPFEITNTLVAKLRAAPCLEIVQFTTLVCSDPTLVPVQDWSKQGLRGAVVRSLTHGGQELLHIRTHTYSVRIADPTPDQRACGHTIVHSPGGIYRVEDEDDDGRAISKYYETGDELEWQDSTHFDGHVVPLEIIRQMRKAAGVKAGDWEGRGVEVGEAAWKVLTTWRDGLEKKTSGATGTAGGQEVKQDDGPQGGVTEATATAIGAA